MREAQNSGRFKKGHKLTEETKQKMRGRKPLNSQQIQVLDNTTNQTTVYESISEAAIALDVKQPSLCRYLKGTQVKPYKNRYIFSKIGPSQ